jgi:predicted ATP-dependent endonuclease of OLD family
MKYRESNLDRNLRKWFVNDNTHQLLRSISLNEGFLRGLSTFKLNLDFPITAIAGKNGTGKSTILAISCCGFHNKSKGFKLSNRKQNYYTFADFFIQHSEDVPPEGIKIYYSIAHNNWRKSEKIPNGSGVAFQLRHKKKGGRWNDYAKRIPRDVVFLGIERIVPHSEKSQSKSYSKSFSNLGEKGWENSVKEVVGKILGKKYDEFKYVTYSKYRLPVVVSNGQKYSGFNMGAGENALFEMFSIMHSVSEGALIVIDEIELGLHSEAQKKLVCHLKNLCKKRKLQIICTTHSSDIFSQLPDDARMFIENVNGKSVITDAISPEFAFSKLSAENSFEFSLLVEDKVAKSIMLSVLPSSIRSRISIEVIGSASALSRQLAANYNRERKDSIVILYDGDQRNIENKNLSYACSMAESIDDIEIIKEWLKSKIEYLPGDTWPESWLIQKCSENIEILSRFIGSDTDELTDILKQGLEAGKHNEFYQIGELVGLDEQETLNRFCTTISQCHEEVFQDLILSLENRLNG